VGITCWTAQSAKHQASKYCPCPGSRVGNLRNRTKTSCVMARRDTVVAQRSTSAAGQALPRCLVSCNRVALSFRSHPQTERTTLVSTSRFVDLSTTATPTTQVTKAPADGAEKAGTGFASVIQLTPEEFEPFILDQMRLNKLVLVDFYTVRCRWGDGA
jgi:hypothetical protein